MECIRAPYVCGYPEASALEWIEADGVGGVSVSSILNANTRKQHALLSAVRDDGGRSVLVANLQEALIDGNRSYDLSTNAYVDAIHPMGYLAIESFAIDPWPRWTYRFDTCKLDKEIFAVHGEHTVVVTYTLSAGNRPMRLVVRPLLAFRDQHAIRIEGEAFSDNWQISQEFAECQPFDGGFTLYIAHPNAKIETVGFWYRKFLYERDRESHVHCIEDLFHPGCFEIPLAPGVPQSLVFATPSPRPIELVETYKKAERTRRQAIECVPGLPEDPLLATLLRAAGQFVYERREGVPGILPGLPWGESHVFRGLMAFSGLLLVPKRFDLARAYLTGVAQAWRRTQSPSRFEPETVVGQMHPADVPLWLFIAAWRYWKATEDAAFVEEFLLPVLEEIAAYYLGGGEARCTGDGLIEVGYEPGADYAPVAPLGTNALWYNAQMILAEMLPPANAAKAQAWRDRAQRMLTAFGERFPSEGRAGFADSVTLAPFRRDETLRASQVLTAGLPYALAADPKPIVELIEKHLATPVGLRTLAPEDPRYVGDGSDVTRLPKRWSASCSAMMSASRSSTTRTTRSGSKSPSAPTHLWTL